MKTVYSQIQKQRFFIYALLVSFLFSGLGIANGLPLLFASVAHSHPVYISEDNHKIRLVLHHPGNRDEHEVSDDYPTEHRHDLFDTVLSVSKTGAFSHTDHEVELPAYEEKVSTASKNNVVHKNSALLAISHALSISMKPIWVHSAPSYAPAINPLSGVLRTTILII